MKRCPQCRRDYFDETLLYCLDDGNALLGGPASIRPATAISSRPSEEAANGISSEVATRVLDSRQIESAELGNSIAVLPFADISNDADNEFFCDGLAEELLNALAKIDNLKVAARTSAFSFKGRKVEVGQIGSALNVKTILDGSVRKSGDQLRITVQLISASDGYHLWSERYDIEMQDIFAVQDEITAAVIDALKVQLLGRRSSTKRPENVTAYELYLKGKYHLAKLTPPDMQKSIECFLRAIEIDETNARAYVGLADAYMRISIAGELPSKEFFPQSKLAAQKAIQLDELSAEGYVAMAWVTFWYDWNWKECERFCRRALELDPNSPEAHTVYAHMLSNNAKHDEALAEISRAKELDPLSLFIGAMQGQFLLHAGRTDDALTALVDLIELEPHFWLPHLLVAGAYIEKGMFAHAEAEANRAKQLFGGSTQAAAFEAFGLALSGKLAEAETLLDGALQISATKYVPPYHLALLYKAVGDLDNALKCLERGIGERDVKMVFLNVEPKWNDIRHDERFRDLLKRTGFSADTS